MSFKILMAGVTHHGRIRTNNEDNLYMGGKYLALGIQDLSEILYVEKSSRPWTAAGVFDGMGGENAGETAAFTGAQTFASCMASWEAQSMTAGRFSGAYMPGHEPGCCLSRRALSPGTDRHYGGGSLFQGRESVGVQCGGQFRFFAQRK